MKKLLFIVLALFSLNALAFDYYNGTNAQGQKQWSSSSVSVDGNGKYFNEALIDNLNNSQPTRSLGWTFGRNTLVQNVRCDLWEGPTCTYVFPASPIQMQVVSTSANDAAAGTGVRTVYIHYLDTNYNEQTEIVTLNGLTPVNTVATNILRINSFHAGSVGSGAAAAGTITLKNTAATVTYAQISAGYNTCRQAIYTVPAGKYGYISHWQAASGTTTGVHYTQVSVVATSHAGVLLPGVFLVVDETGVMNGPSEINLPIPIRIAPMSDVKMTAISDAANANAVVNGAIMGWLETQ